jgi:hydroxylysine kinase
VRRTGVWAVAAIETNSWRRYGRGREPARRRPCPQSAGRRLTESQSEGEASRLGASLVQSPAPLSAEQASDLARGAFGIMGPAKPLRSERDENFLIRTRTGDFVLKVINPAEDPTVSDFHAQALLHAAIADPALPAPRLVPARDGAPQACVDLPGGRRVVQLLTFLPGLVAADAPRSMALRVEIARMLARFDRLFRDFRHPAADHPLSWDLKHAARLREMLAGLQDSAERALAERALDGFDLTVAPALPRLRAQVIHNDFNLHNVLVSQDAPPRIVGILDFGDMIWAPLVNDLAIAMSYHVAQDADPLVPAVEMAVAYHGLTPLEAVESDLLYDLVAARMAMTLLITDWRARRHPENAAYITKNRPAALAGLARFGEVTRREAQDRFRRALRLEAAP